MKKPQINCFIFGSFCWYVIEYLFKVVFTNNYLKSPPSILTAMIAGIALTLAFNASSNYKKALQSSFKIALLITCSELIIGASYYHFFDGQRFWNYTGLFLNLHGFICLKYSMIWWVVSYGLIGIIGMIRRKNLTL